MEVTYDEFVRILKEAFPTVIEDEDDCTRFKVETEHGVKYNVKWFKNESYITTEDHTRFIFNDFKISSSYPTCPGYNLRSLRLSCHSVLCGLIVLETPEIQDYKRTVKYGN